MIDLDRIHAWSESEARENFLRCCGSRRWADHMTAARPFADEDAVYAAAAAADRVLSRADWLEAFAAHPRIGDLDTLKKRFAGGGWAAGEQAGIAGAPETTLQALAAGNAAYEQKFGHIFIVCATGKNAAEMLALLEQRLANGPEDELRLAAAEQAKISRLRLEKLER